MAGAMVAALLIRLSAGILATERQYTWVDPPSCSSLWSGWPCPSSGGDPGQDVPHPGHLRDRPFPVAGYGDGALIYMVLPSLVLGTHLSATIARITRSSMLKVKPQPYMVTTVAKGLHRWRVVLVHQLKNRSSRW